MIHCDAGPNVVRSYPVKENGAGYSAEIVNVIKATDKWFRPSDVVVAPDGSLMVADWYDPGVGGHAMGDHNWPDMHGRIYRVAPPGTPYKMPPMDLSSADGAVEVLTSPESSPPLSRLDDAARNGRQGRAGPAETMEGDRPAAPRRALWLLAKIDGKGQQYVDAAVKDSDPNIRIVGIRVGRELKLDLIPTLKTLASDPSAQVRRDVAIALHLTPSPEVPAIWARARHPARRQGPLVSRSPRHRRSRARRRLPRRLPEARRRQVEHARRPRHRLAVSRPQLAAAAPEDHPRPRDH